MADGYLSYPETTLVRADIIYYPTRNIRIYRVRQERGATIFWFSRQKMLAYLDHIETKGFPVILKDW